MEKFQKHRIGIIISSHVFFGVLTYWIGLHSKSEYINTQEIEQTSKDSATDKFINTFSDIPAIDIHSPIYLKKLSNYEGFTRFALMDLTRNHSNLFPPELVARIEEYLFFFHEELLRANLNQFTVASEVSKNPLLTINMIFRFSHELTDIFEELQKQPYISRVPNGIAKSFLNGRKAIANWPNKSTFEAAMIELFQIQMVYDLDANELAYGRLYGQDTGVRMNIPLLFELGKYARQNKIYTIAVPWLEIALQEMIILQENPRQVFFPLSLPEIKNCLMETVMEHDMEWPQREFGDYYFYMNKLLDENQDPVSAEDRIPFRKLDFTRIQRKPAANEINYWNLCSGQNHQTEQEKSRLFCWYDTTTNLALTIYPIKKEMLSETPQIIQMYDVIGDKYTTELVDAMIKSSSNNDTSKEASAVGSTDFQNLLSRLNGLIEVSTGLSATPRTSAERFVADASTFGGYYDCRSDALEYEDTESGMGNRIATILFHLDEAMIGGSTAFPQAGIAARSVKGSAVFWYNLKRNGDVDATMQLCPCPVVMGHKTIVMQRIRHNDQFRRRQCGLQKDD